MIETTIDLLRHGAVENASLLVGHTDVALSNKGWNQLWTVVENKPVPWEIIISSPLQRCAAFAQMLAYQNQLTFQVNDRLREIGFGSWEGCDMAELYKRKNSLLTTFWNNPVENPAPEGEPMAEFENRVLTSWEQLLEKHSGKHYLLVIHGGPIRIILRTVLRMPVNQSFRIEIPHASFSRIRYDKESGPRLVFHGGCL